MAIYRLSQRATNATTAQAIADIATSTGVRPRLMECLIVAGVAGSVILGLARSTALGTRTTPAALIPDDPQEPALTGITLVNMAIAWSVQPTISATNLITGAPMSAIGASLLWVFPRGIIIAVSTSLCLTNRTAGLSAADVTFSADV